VLLTDDSGTSVAKFSAGDIPAIFNIPATPAPTCYYSSIAPTSPQGGVAYVDTHRTLLYIGLSDSQTADLIASIRKTISVKPWTVHFDYDVPPATPRPPRRRPPRPGGTTTSRAPRPTTRESWATTSRHRSRKGSPSRPV
jgi:hypothetical protein